MDGVVGQIAIDPRRLADGPLAIKVMEEVEKIVGSQLEAAIDQLNRRHPTLEVLVDILMKNNRLAGLEPEAI